MGLVVVGDPNPEQIWAAGLFVGEGCISTSNRGELHFAISMLDERAIRRFAAALAPGMPERWNHKQKPPIPVSFGNGRYARIHLGGRRAYAAILMLLPYLEGTDKGDQAQAALKRHVDLASPTRYDLVWAGRRAKFGPSGGNANQRPRKLSAVCRHGHEYTPENTYFDPSGKRYCRACRDKNRAASRERLSFS